MDKNLKTFFLYLSKQLAYKNIYNVRRVIIPRYKILYYFMPRTNLS